MADDSSTKTNSKQVSEKKSRFVDQNHTLKKRQSHKYQTGKNVVYVNSKSNTKGLLERCSKLINEDENEIIIYCMGAAIQRGILLALQITEKYITFKIHTNTLTTTLIDDLEPNTDDADYETQTRQNSALKIRVFRSDPSEA